MSELREFVALELFQIAGVPVTVASVGTFVLIMIAAWIVSRGVQRITATAMGRAGLREEGTVRTATKLLHYVVLFVGLAVALQTVGISLTSIFAAGAFVAVGVGFALQNILQNFVSGVILLAERSITEEDVLLVDGEMILVERIGARATVARTRDDLQRIIPNSSLVQSTVDNFTLSDETYRIRSRVGVAYSSDMDRVEAALERAARTIPERQPDRDPGVLLLEFGDSSVVWEVSIWANDPWAAPVTRSALNRAVWNALQEDGITIAFPQLDVHLVSTPDASGRSDRGDPAASD
jgi:small-conductance mechanosensitive channel